MGEIIDHVRSRHPSEPAPHRRSVRQHVDTALAALTDNTRRAYRSAWTAWQRWTAEHRRSPLPASADDVADYLQARHATGAAPASIRVACAAIARVHQVAGFPSPVADCRCRDLLRQIYREGRSRGRGQVAGVGWKQAEEAAARAEDSGSLQGLRDGAIVRLMSDSLARVSEVSALQYCDVEPETTTSGGTVLIRASKNDQFGDGSTRYIGPATLAAVGRYLTASGHTSGPLFRRLLRGGQSSPAALGPDSIRKIVRQRVAEVTGGAGRVGGHSLRVGSARELAAAGASLAELQQAGGWRSPASPEVYIRREAAARGPVARRRYQVG